LVLDAADILLAPRMTELQDQLAVVLMHRVANRPPERNLVVVVDGGVAGNDPPSNAHRHERGDDCADASARELHLPIDAGLIARTVIVVEPTGYARPEDPVLDGQVTALQFLKNRLIGHARAASSLAGDAGLQGGRIEAPVLVLAGFHFGLQRSQVL